MMMNEAKVLQQLRQGQASPVYVCFGEERFRLQQFITTVVDLLVDPDLRDLAVNRYDLNEHDIGHVLEDAETLPFMVPSKVVIANNATFLTAARSKREASVEHDVDRLINYVQSPVDYTILILVVTAQKLDERRRIVKALRQHAIVLPFQPLTGRDLTLWVDRQFKQFTCTIGQEAAQLLVQNVGNNMQLLMNEIEKIALYAGASGEVTAEMIEAIAIRSLEQNIFKLIDFIVIKRTDEALALLTDMLLQREEPVKILLLIARQYRIVMQVAELSQQGKTAQQIASQLRLQPFVVRDALTQSRHYNARSLQRIIGELAQLDFMMKTGKIDKELALEMLILKLA